MPARYGKPVHGRGWIRRERKPGTRLGHKRTTYAPGRGRRVLREARWVSRRGRPAHPPNAPLPTVQALALADARPSGTQTGRAIVPTTCPVGQFTGCAPGCLFERGRPRDPRAAGVLRGRPTRVAETAFASRRLPRCSRAALDELALTGIAQGSRRCAIRRGPELSSTEPAHGTPPSIYQPGAGKPLAGPRLE
jgi:hypothetical protein